MSRLTETRKNGVFSYGGLLGRGDEELYKINISGEYPDYEAWYTHQYDTYLKDQIFETYNVYLSQSGAQGMVFGALDQMSPFTPGENLRIYRVLASLSFAIILGLLLLWFLTEFGLSTAILTFITTLASPWFTLFGRNIFYVPTFFYIPIVAVTYYLNCRSNQIERNYLKLSLIVFVTILLKCLFNGFDFILPSILMLAAPLIYFALRDNWGMRKFIQACGVTTISVTAAIFIALLILSVQISVVLDNFPQAVTYLLDTFSRRTMGDPQQFPEYAASLKANTWDVLLIYFQGNTAVAKTNLRFMDLIFIFAVFTGAYFLKEKLQARSSTNTNKVRALAITTWVSIFSPLLWYIIFKGQAYIHTRTNFLAWYMPFTIYGFALCGYILQNLISKPKQANTTFIST